MGIPIAINSTPRFTEANCAQTTQRDGDGVAVSASAKVCIAPEIATEIAPASARCSGSQSTSRSAAGSRSDNAAAVSQTRAAV